LTGRAPTAFTKQIGPDVLGVVTLGVVVLDDGTVEVDPSSGVRHEPLERLLAELTGQKHHGYLPATIGSAIGYITPAKRFLIFTPFTTSGDPAPDVQHIVETITRYGFRWMEENQSLDALLHGMVDFKYIGRDGARFRVPLIYYLKGEFEATGRSLEEGLAEVGETPGPVSDQFRRFAKALLNRLPASA
jgi:hypothetical protein